MKLFGYKEELFTMLYKLNISDKMPVIFNDRLMYISRKAAESLILLK